MTIQYIFRGSASSAIQQTVIRAKRGKIDEGWLHWSDVFCSDTALKKKTFDFSKSRANLRDDLYNVHSTKEGGTFSFELLFPDALSFNFLVKYIYDFLVKCRFGVRPNSCRKRQNSVIFSKF